MPTLPIISSTDLNTKKAQSLFAEKGCLIAKQVFNASDLQPLLVEFRALIGGKRGPLAVLDGPDDASQVSFTEDDILSLHFPHKLSPLMQDVMRHPAIVDVLRYAIGENVKCIQSMFFVKKPGMRGEAPHQDEARTPTRLGKLVAAWIALEDATLANGCLWCIPGSHATGVQWPVRFVDNELFDRSWMAYGYPYNDGDWQSLEVKAGSVVFFHGHLLHRSFPNQSNHERLSLVYHYAAAEALIPWATITRNCWPDYLPPRLEIATYDLPDYDLVCGTDPYAGLRPTVFQNKPSVRLSGGMGDDCGSPL